MLHNKRILVGVTGGIAAYKINLLVRMLIKEGAEVRCIMTPASLDFISPLTLATLSQHPVAIHFWDKNSGEWENHVALGGWADLFVIAPLTANSMSKMVSGQADNLLLATYLSAKCPIMVCPAMDLDMYVHPSSLRNMDVLSNDGVQVLPAEEGFLASGLEGKGRMAEPETILQAVIASFSRLMDLEGVKVLITAGPTYEALDPVRFIGNHSSGKMGFALANAILQRGGEVILVTGPTQEKLEHEKLKRIDIQSAEEMLSAVQHFFSDVNAGIFSAAVSDYRPAMTKTQKMKKSDAKLTLELVKNPDILAWAGTAKKSNQLLCGFALETENAVQNAQGKLERKNLDFIVLNTLEDEGAGFGHDTNKVLVLDKNNNSKQLELQTKSKIAEQIVSHIFTNFKL